MIAFQSADATLNLGGNFTTTGDVLVSNAGYVGANLNVINLTGTRTFNIGASTTTTVNPDIAGVGGLTKTGNGTLALTGLVAATYAGDTTVSAGTLLVHGAITGTSKVDVTDTGTLGGTGTITPLTGGNVNLLSGGKLSPGASVGTLNTVFSAGGVLDLSASVNTVNSQALAFEIDTVASSDKVTLTGGALKIGTGVLEFDDFNFSTLGGFVANSTYVLFQGDTAIDGTLGTNISGLIGSFAGELQFADSNTDLVLVVVPEPGTAVSLLGGLGLMLGRRRSS